MSDDIDPLLELQGLSWFTRKAIGLATVVVCLQKRNTSQLCCHELIKSHFQLTVKEYVTDSVYHIDITSVAMRFATTQENRTLDWANREHSDSVFGKVIGKSRMFRLPDFRMEGPGPQDDATFLKAEKLKDLKTPSRFLDDPDGFVQSWVVSQGSGWTAEQVWGFEDVDGRRRHTRRVVVRKGDKVQRARLVYDYRGPAGVKRDDSEDLAYGD